LLLGDGDGGFTVGERFDFGDSVGGEILDVDLDGKADLAFAENSQRQVTVVFDVAGERNVVGFADPQGINEGLHPDQRAAPSLAVGDFDENGYPDLVRPSFTPVVNIFKNVGDPTNRSVVRIDLGDDPRAVAVADLDADGHDDLLFGHWTVEEQAGVIVLLGDGTGGFANHGRYSLGGANLVYNLGVAPLDTTGQLYVISAFYDQVRLLPVLPGGSLGAPIEIGRPDHSTLRLAVADLDGDGLPEIVTPNYVFRNRGDCGNGTVTEGEACDDGNGETCDGCDASCRIEIGTLCGDGVVSSDCDEQCDDGDLNADAPDRCRSSCRLPACGDGIVDTGEQCDDGNTESCDGCSATCVVDTIPVCGDGVLDTFCGEQCDDGGTVYGDGCDGRCLVEHAPGGGGRKTDCLLEWIIDNPTNDPLYDRRDRISSKQICRDNDPDCDADGGVTGTCTFRVSMCLAVADGDYPDCGPARMSALEIRRPSTRELAKNPGAGPVRERVFAAFEAAATGPAGSCSDLLELPVPMRRNGTRPGRLVLKVGATSADGRRDHDALRFKCVAR
jgi:cysteine-rich repeat protein